MNVKLSVNQRKVRKTARHQSVNSIAQGVAKKAIEIDLLPVQPYYGTTEAAMRRAVCLARLHVHPITSY